MAPPVKRTVKAGSVIDPRFLQLVSNQSLRTSVIAAQPEP